mgnify:CR=1 FL=1
MSIFGKHGENADLSASIGLSNLGNQFWNLSPAELVEDTILSGQGVLTDTGALAIETGEFTGRSPKDRFVVCDEKTENSVWWGDINIKFTPEKFDAIYNRMKAYLNGKDVYVRDTVACADPTFAMNIRVITEFAWSNMFAYNMFLRPAEKELQNLVVRVAGAYFEALLADEQLELVLAQKTTFSAMLDAAQKAIVAGSGTRTDIDDARSRLDMAAAQELEARQNQDLTKRQLQLLINQPVTKLAALNVGALKLVLPEPANVNMWTQKAEEASPEIKSLRARLEASKREVSKAQAGHLPTLDAVAQWSNSGSENITRINSRYETKSVGIQLSIPLYSGGYVNSTIRQAVAEQIRAEETLEALRRDLGVRVHKEFRGMTEGVLRVRALEQAVRSAEQMMRSTQMSLKAGARTQLDVLNAQQQYTLALRDLAQARFVYLMSKVKLSALAGEDAVSSVDQVNAALVVQ